MRLVPLPVSFEPRDGSFDLRTPFEITCEGDRTQSLPAAWKLSGQLGAVLRRRFGVRATPMDDCRRRITFATVAGFAAEGYALDVAPDTISVTASTRDGLFHGARTLAQLVDFDAEGRAIPEIPSCRIVDEPRFAWRGMHLDVARHFYDKHRILEWIDLLALHKFNVFHWHLTDDQGWRLPIDRYPRLTEVGGFRRSGDGVYGGSYSKSDVHEIVEQAARKGVTVVPEIEMPGHAMAALAAYPELSCTGGPFEVGTEWGIYDDVFCAGNDHVFEFLEAVLDETLELFQAPWIHIGGDECPKARWAVCPKCRARMRKEKLATPEALQGWFTSQIAAMLARRGRRIIGWDEILEGEIPADAVIMSWRGEKGGIEAARRGHDVIMSPTTHCYLDYKQRDVEAEPGAIGVIPLERAYAFEPRPSVLSDAQAKHILGAQGNVWTERMPSWERVQFMALPRMSALAEVVWSPPGARRYADFESRLRGHLRWLGNLGCNYRPLDSDAAIEGRAGAEA